MAVELMGERDFPPHIDSSAAFFHSVHRSHIEQAALHGIGRNRGKVRSIPMVVDSTDVVDQEE